MTVSNDNIHSLMFDAKLIHRFDILGPRYTSYPTADRFTDTFNADKLATWLGARPMKGGTMPVSLYVHIPFCDTACAYCACNKIITKHHERSARYVQYVIREIEMQAALLRSKHKAKHKAVQLHLGGGTPTFLSADEMRALIAALRAHFEFAPDGEYSIEIDPRKANAETVHMLGELGFNRMSIGVQDFTPEVQRAVNRMQSVAETRAVIEAARASNAGSENADSPRESQASSPTGFKSISVDLIYGLPLQTVETFERTLDEVIALAPDRVSIYNYAHLPRAFKTQRTIKKSELPLPEVKLQIFGRAIERLTNAGYVYIGMDHFARPDNELTVAQRQGRLHRNFQGYSTHADCNMLAFGVSSISKVGSCYSQNFRTLDAYYEALDRGELPVMRGMDLSLDDLLRRDIIQALMCHFELSINAIEDTYLIDFKQCFADELKDLREMENAGLLEINDQWISVLPRGRLLVRAIAMVFDRYLRKDRELKEHAREERYSKVI